MGKKLAQITLEKLKLESENETNEEENKYSKRDLENKNKRIK